MGQAGSAPLEEMVNTSNCMVASSTPFFARLLTTLLLLQPMIDPPRHKLRHFSTPLQLVSVDEIQRLYKRFMKLDKDGSGSIDKEEFLSIPQIANNPLASRMIAIFDEDGGGDVDFKEFIKGLSAFSAKGNKREKLQCMYKFCSRASGVVQLYGDDLTISYRSHAQTVAFKVYDMDRDGFISNGELFIVLKMMVGNNLKDNQLQQIVDKTIMEADKDMDGKISFDEFLIMVENTDVAKQMTLESF
ncbi:hypothetical protein BC938DRAFT_479826 [Jimgerdemannia flammicorona]|uniref:Calcineurin subunit B n=1 Tax=Jimgerdemannia flammicorona TaxID=994334 RepID=A0A433QK30_9FUNG|nr:hypothetical protein BC938DRAFT_479826 [Jimgerdemannia flammicorona]